MLATATCNLIRKCLPVIPLPLSSALNHVQFPLDQFKGLDTTSSDAELKREESSQEDESSTATKRDIKSSSTKDSTGPSTSQSLTDVCSDDIVQSIQLEALGLLSDVRVSSLQPPPVHLNRIAESDKAMQPEVACNTVFLPDPLVTEPLQCSVGVKSTVMISDKAQCTGTVQSAAVQPDRVIQSNRTVLQSPGTAQSSAVSIQSNAGLLASDSSQLELTQGSSADHSSCPHLWFIHTEANEISHKFDLLAFNQFFPEVSFVRTLRRSTSLPTVSSAYRDEGFLHSSFSASCVERNGRSSKTRGGAPPFSSPRLAASSQTECKPLLFRDSSPILLPPSPSISTASLDPFYKKLPSVERLENRIPPYLYLPNECNVIFTH